MMISSRTGLENFIDEYGYYTDEANKKLIRDFYKWEEFNSDIVEYNNGLQVITLPNHIQTLEEATVWMIEHIWTDTRFSNYGSCYEVTSCRRLLKRDNKWVCYHKVNTYRDNYSEVWG